jgi:hypothetical protein
MVAEAGGRCTYCQRRMEDPRWLHREHDILLSRCGQNHVDDIWSRAPATTGARAP